MSRLCHSEYYGFFCIALGSVSRGFLDERDGDREWLKRPSSAYYDQYPGDHKRTLLGTEYYTGTSRADYSGEYECSVHDSNNESRTHIEDSRRNAPVTSQYEHEPDRYRTYTYYDQYSYSSGRDLGATPGYETNAYYRVPERDHMRTDDPRESSDVSLYNRDFYRDRHDGDSQTRLAGYENYYGSHTMSAPPHLPVGYNTQVSPVPDAYNAQTSTYSSATHNTYDRGNYNQQEYPDTRQYTSTTDSYSHVTSPSLSYSPNPRYPQQYSSYYQYSQGERSSYYDAAPAQSSSYSVGAQYPGRIPATGQSVAFDRTRYGNN